MRRLIICSKFCCSAFDFLFSYKTETGAWSWLLYLTVFRAGLLILWMCMLNVALNLWLSELFVFGKMVILFWHLIFSDCD